MNEWISVAGRGECWRVWCRTDILHWNKNANHIRLFSATSRLAKLITATRFLRHYAITTITPLHHYTTIALSQYFYGQTPAIMKSRQSGRKARRVSEWKGLRSLHSFLQPTLRPLTYLFIVNVRFLLSQFSVPSPLIVVTPVSCSPNHSLGVSNGRWLWLQCRHQRCTTFDGQIAEAVSQTGSQPAIQCGQEQSLRSQIK